MSQSKEIRAKDVRVRAPEFKGRGWLNTGGRALTLASTRGRIVVLDFWTFCCINCLHVLDELRPLEEKYSDVLVIIGVHSPKFEHEKDPVALAAAVERYGVTHPVLDDFDMNMWQQYTAKAWPTLSVIDPEGYVVASMAGEGHAEGLARLIDQLVEEHERKGTLVRGEGPYVPPEPKPTDLRFPGKAISLGEQLLVADSAHHSLVFYDPATERVHKRIGDKERGHVDGPADRARFNEPGGMVALPAHIREICGYDVVVADTVNHLLRGVDTATGEVVTVAGSGRPWRSSVDFDAHDALAVDLSSPWDLAWYDDLVIIAMAGIHQLWWFDPIKRTAGVYAGTTVEALRDGPLKEAWFAQPSGLSAHGNRLWIADSESSALRYVENGEVHTVVGQGLFDFGLVDGPAAEALLQHPLGVLADDNGDVLVADTYNGAVRRYRDGRVETVATGLGEPSDLVRTPDGIFVVESSTHRLTRLEARGAGPVDEARMRTERPVTTLTPGAITLDVIFEPAPGQKLDVSFGPATRLEVTAWPPELLAAGVGVTEALSRELVLRPGVGVLQITAQAATCDAEAEHPACHLTRQDWGVPIEVAEGGAERLPLVLRGLDVSS
ncbi:redoxin domain-containing protein [Virgisporangium ochraceum]